MIQMILYFNTWQDFFKNIGNSKIEVDHLDRITIDELYHHFKERLKAETNLNENKNVNDNVNVVS